MAMIVWTPLTLAFDLTEYSKVTDPCYKFLVTLSACLVVVEGEFWEKSESNPLPAQTAINHQFQI